jgi:serine/threonine-protein kinase
MSDPIVRLNAALEGRYQVERMLGQGGMATVYLARDLKHARPVALKVLKPELSSVVGPDRFVAEIRTTASLQHPHILPLFDSGQADGFLFYVTPYVEGESLRDRLDRDQQLPVGQAVRIATDVAEAIDYAHRHGVVHRDVKPANVLLQDDKPLVADFGIALAVGSAGGGRLTETGLSLGTPHYMSPEQAAGDAHVGRATDVYALGCVLYEMLAGEPPYTGRTPQAVLGKIIQARPEPIREHRPGVPPNVAATIERALERVPADRFATAQDFAAALAEPGFRHQGRAHAAEGARYRPAVALGGWVTAAAAALVAAWAVLRVPPEGPLVSRQVLAVDRMGAADASFGLLAAVSPDGSHTVVPVGSAPHGLGLKRRASVDVVPIPDTEGARSVVFSPDGRHIAYTSGTRLVRRDLQGSAPITLAEDVDNAAAAVAWLSDGTIVYEQMSGGTGFVARLVRIPEGGGATLQVVESSGAGAGFPIWMHGLPDARRALVVSCEGIATCTAEASALYVLDLADGSLERVMDRVMRAWYVAAVGQLVYVRPDGAVLAVDFDLATSRPSGGSVPLIEGVRVGAIRADMVMGDDGTVLYVEGLATAYGPAELVWVDRAGRAELLDSALGPRGFTTLALSPNAEALAVSIETVLASEVWVKDVADGPLTRLTQHAGGTRWPSWGSDGRAILYINNEGGTPHVRSVRSDGGSAMAYDVVLRNELPVMEALPTPDGRGMFYRAGQPPFTESRVGFMAYAAPPATLPAPSGLNEQALALSRDGRWLAYRSEATGRREVYVRAADGTGGRTQVSPAGGTDPLWAHNGRELFYRASPSGAMMAIGFSAQPDFRVVSRTELFDASGYIGGIQERGSYDVALDDQRFAMMRTPSSGVARLILIENWVEELRQRTGR